MNKERSTIFCQSLLDFPCPVTLGRNTPDFGLHRFKKGLRFIPSDDEGFTMRGDKWRLLYKGRRKSHRFTILGDTAFEYDCILLKEPESNVISLLMEGAENFDFFRQPDFVKEPYLKGSYAVYKKETLIGEGTGKLCHIHRPEIIDARGRRCWGNLLVVGNELRITVPEWFLSDAKYPVIVDPLIGTTTVGSNIAISVPDHNTDWPYLDCAYSFNKYIVPNSGNGVCTAYVYCYSYYTEEYVKPLLYTNLNNKPYNRKSFNENEIYVDVWPPYRYPRWSSNTFTINGNITEGDYVWFGVYASWFTTLFDYGVECYIGEFGYEDDYYTPPTYINVTQWDTYCDIKWSWYFTYGPPQNYVRTVTQGVKLSDIRKFTRNYKRNLTQTAGVSSLLKRISTFYRKCFMTVCNSMIVNRYPVFFRKVVENINVIFDLFNLRSLLRNCSVNVNVTSQANRLFNAIRKIQDMFTGTDEQNFNILFIRTVADNFQITDIFRRWGAFIRELRVNSESMAETSHIADYKRFNSDTVKAFGVGLRSIFLFVRIVANVFIRDYILHRFLKANEDFILKSPICREIILDSKID